MWQVFRGANVKLGNWRQVTVPIQKAVRERQHAEWSVQDTRGSVSSHRLSYLFLKVRKGGDFFYGKSGNENHIESL